MYTRICVGVHACVCIRVCVFVCVCVCARVHVGACVYKYMHVCTMFNTHKKTVKSKFTPVKYFSNRWLVTSDNLSSTDVIKR